LFSRFGTIQFAGISKNENGDKTGIVLFENREDALKAVHSLSGKVIDGSGVSIELNL
jgi:hypothetical protein